MIILWFAWSSILYLLLAAAEGAGKTHMPFALDPNPLAGDEGIEAGGRVMPEARENDMRRIAFASIVMFVWFAFGFGAYAQQSDISAAPSPVWNDNSLITIQKDGGDPTRFGDVKIVFYGHDAFKITSPTGLTVLTDPWRNDSTSLYPKWFLNEFPALRVDIVLSTHAHFDHDAVDRPNGLMVLERLVGQFRLGDIEITGLSDKHKCEPAPPDKPGSASANLHVESCPPNNVMAFDNAIQIVETGGLRVAIWATIGRCLIPPSIIT